MVYQLDKHEYKKKEQLLKQSLIKIGQNEYPYFYCDDTKKLLNELLKNDAGKYYFIYDSNIGKNLVFAIKGYLGDKKNCIFIELEVSETTKNINMVDNISEELIKLGVTRSSCLVAVGGGVLGNIVGLVASLIFRGVKLIHMPTTVIAAADSVLSLKQAVNTKLGKNLLGTFYKPCGIYTDYNLFKSLSRRDYISGIAELVKNLLTIIPDEIESFLEVFRDGVTCSKEELTFIIECSIKAKTKVLLNDVYEKKDGLILEYGHTTGHVIEFLSQNNVKHGEGVAFGMLVASEVGRLIGVLSNEHVEMHYKLLNKINILSNSNTYNCYSNKEIIDLMRYDNKRGYLRSHAKDNEFPMVILKGYGNAIMTEGYLLNPVNEHVLNDAINIVKNKLV